MIVKNVQASQQFKSISDFATHYRKKIGINLTEHGKKALRLEYTNGHISTIVRQYETGKSIPDRDYILNTPKLLRLSEEETRIFYRLIMDEILKMKSGSRLVEMCEVLKINIPSLLDAWEPSVEQLPLIKAKPLMEVIHQIADHPSIVRNPRVHARPAAYLFTETTKRQYCGERSTMTFIKPEEYHETAKAYGIDKVDIKVREYNAGIICAYFNMSRGMMVYRAFKTMGVDLEQMLLRCVYQNATVPA